MRIPNTQAQGGIPLGLFLMWMPTKHSKWWAKMKVERVSLVVVPPPKSEDPLLIAPKGREIVIKGGTDVGLILECGSCAQALAEGVRERQLGGVTLRCSRCGAYNQVMR